VSNASINSGASNARRCPGNVGSWCRSFRALLRHFLLVRLLPGNHAELGLLHSGLMLLAAIVHLLLVLAVLAGFLALERC
jgi:hypothetical protein